MKKAKMMLQVHRNLALIGIQEIRDYSDAIESLITNEAARIGRELEEYASHLREEEKEEFYEHNAEYYQNLAIHFPNQFRLGLVSSSYSVLEDRIVRIADTLGTSMQSKVKINDFKGDAYSRAKVFLDKVVQLPIEPSAWEGVAHYNLIRNAIVHNSGRLNKDHNKFRAVSGFIHKHRNIEADDSGGIIVNSGFVAAYLNEIELLFKEIFRAWEQWQIISPVKP